MIYIINIFVVLCVGESKAPPVLIHGLRGGAPNTARHVMLFVVIVLAFLTQNNKAGKIKSTLKHGKGRAVRDNGTRGVFSIDQYSTHLRHVLYIAISTTHLVPLLRVQHFLPCFNYYLFIFDS